MLSCEAGFLVASRRMIVFFWIGSWQVGWFVGCRTAVDQHDGTTPFSIFCEEGFLSDNIFCFPQMFRRPRSCVVDASLHLSFQNAKTPASGFDFRDDHERWYGTLVFFGVPFEMVLKHVQHVLAFCPVKLLQRHFRDRCGAGRAGTHRPLSLVEVFYDTLPFRQNRRSHRLGCPNTAEERRLNLYGPGFEKERSWIANLRSYQKCHPSELLHANAKP